jgi:putative ABC transport system substrate-binding protein
MNVSRRKFVTLISSAIAAGPLNALAQQRVGTRRIAMLILGSESDPIPRTWVAAFQEGLRHAGWSENNNLRTDLRFAADRSSIRSSAEELVKLAPDLILVHSSPGTSAIRQKTKTIPIVFVAVGDPVVNGFVEEIAHPKGNATGFTNLFPSIGGKWLELLKEAAPRMVRVGLLFNPEFEFSKTYFPPIETAAPRLSVQIVRMPYRSSTELGNAVNAMAAEPNGGLVILPPLSNYPREFILRLQETRLPAISTSRSFATAGGLMSYGADNVDLFRRASSYVDRILRGEKPSDLPVQFPTKFEMVLNLKTVKAMDLNISRTLRAFATEVIE